MHVPSCPTPNSAGHIIIRPRSIQTYLSSIMIVHQSFCPLPLTTLRLLRRRPVSWQICWCDPADMRSTVRSSPICVRLSGPGQVNHSTNFVTWDKSIIRIFTRVLQYLSRWLTTARRNPTHPFPSISWNCGPLSAICRLYLNYFCWSPCFLHEITVWLLWCWSTELVKPCVLRPLDESISQL